MKLFPEIQPYQTHQLVVSNLHTLYIEESGNPNGQPVLFVHGGPGGGTNPSYRQFFDPVKFRIILFDQRGCGQSTPFLELQQNTTQDLVQDMEKIRQLLQIQEWILFGGSWGSTLSLVYAQAFPERVKAMVLRGIFLFEQAEIDWFLQAGVETIFPEVFEEYRDFIPKEEQSDLVKAYYARAISLDNDIAVKTFKSLSKYETSIARLQYDQSEVAKFVDSPAGLSMGKIELHYMQHKGFLTEGQILQNIHKIQDIPGYIVHGRYDIICPFLWAWKLHKAWPKSELFPVLSGHSGSDPEMQAKLTEVVNSLV